MKTLLDDVFDKHWIHVNNFQNTTFNIIVKVKINRRIENKNLSNALDKLVSKHPHFTGILKEGENKNQNVSFHLDNSAKKHIPYSSKRCSTKEIDEEMESLSKDIRKRLAIKSGELINANLYSSNDESIIELVCAHLVGDATAVIFLMKDLMQFIDEDINNVTTPTENSQKRLMFDETRYGWHTERIPLQTFSIPEDTSTINDWPMPDLTYKRFSFDLKKFKEIEKTLKKKNIKASAIDFFYYSAVSIFNDNYKKVPTITTVQSFRKLLPTKNDQKNINTSAAFKSININNTLLNNPKEWLEDFHLQRKNSLRKEELMGLATFLRTLNLTLDICNKEQGKTLLYNLMPIKAFAFNNLGEIGNYFQNYKSFEVTDINYQDATPGEFFRVYGFQDKIYMSPIFYKDGDLDCMEFWGQLNTKLGERLLQIS